MDLAYLRRIGLLQAHIVQHGSVLPEPSAQPAMARPTGTLLKLVSGGQTGVDQAALAAATHVAVGDVAVATKGIQRPRFRCEEKPSSGFSPLFLNEPALRTAAVNAGDYRLYLGGGSINRAFGDLLKEQQGLKFGKTCEPYEKLHLALLAASRDAGGKMVAARDVPEAEKLLERLHLALSFGQAGEAFVNDTIGSASGAVFLDVFVESKQPLAHGNIAMLYVVGPKGDKCKGPKGNDAGPLLPRIDFLASIERLGKKALELVAACNQAEACVQIQEVRWCLVSGGVYCHGDVSKVEVASATLRGMLSAEDSTDLTVTFTYDDDVFRQALELCDISVGANY